MFLGLEWHWWLAILAVAGVSIPFKVKFIKWWGERRQAQKDHHTDQWGDEA